MAFNAGKINTQIKKEEPLKAPLSILSTEPITLEFEKEEIEVLLLMIKESHFKGEHIEKIYKLVYKLQECYKQL
jgi:hypothetical protein